MRLAPDVLTGRTAGAARLPREVWVLVSASFVIAVGYGLVAPALPVFARSFDVGVTAASLVISAFAFLRLAFGPVSGRLVSKIGERPVYLTGLLVVALSTGAVAFAHSYWQLLLFRSLGGIGSTMFTVSSVSLLVRLSPPALRGRASGLWATSFLLGNIAGPVLGGGLVTISLRLPFLAYAVALLVAVAVAATFLRRSALADPDRSAGVPPVTFRHALAHRSYRAALTSSFANGWTTYGVRISLIPLFVAEVLHREQSWAGVALAVFAAGNAAVLLLAGRLSDAHGRKPLVLAGLAVSAAGTAWLGWTTALPAFLAASLLAGVGSGLLNPPHTAAVADVLGSQARGGPVLAGFQMAADLGAIIGPLVAGVIADGLSYRAAFTVTGVVSVLALLVWLRAPETLPARAAAAQPAPVTPMSEPTR